MIRHDPIGEHQEWLFIGFFVAIALTRKQTLITKQIAASNQTQTNTNDGNF
jgi:hypothetical protein